MKTLVLRLLACALIPVFSWGFIACDGAEADLDALVAEPGEELSGGANGTIFNSGANAFGIPSPGLDNQEELFFGVGNSFFNQSWVSAPASTTARDGLGPFFNARACSSCHFKDGRGRPPAFAGERPTGWLVRTSVGSLDAQGNPIGDERYGTQIQDAAINGFPAEAALTVTYEEIPGQFADGTPYSLRRPTISVSDEAFGPLGDLPLSGRTANHLSGMGLLEAIPEQTILALADPNDADGDGISGRANMVWNIREGRSTLGRFGWKAEQPTVEQQVASAFHGDMGLTSSLFPDENCAPASPGCTEAPTGGSPEVEDRGLGHVTLYSGSLAVPARRDWEEPAVLRGKALFAQIGCAGCHVPKFETGISTISASHENQVIRPYTDLLLHDMGEGLADDLATFDASGREWRTPPLWGLGLIQTVNGHMELLHDGRARGVVEAILWHGGEAEAARERFRALSQSERDDLVRFLHSL
ncbi:MAG: di-heme oxidoredictase family protein [Bacteroidota bacterium]